ncbi:LLM class F420-dependent oxidoreductase [Mycolicibacterium aichiense]|uniref:LLM class F420-dependent oxidoreductase n=1 Tax=Mycolicibacterium aichiense TaxID=1799 RepID=A0AAD1HIN0_9MYCO|nr:LLM class F420-dependent oxidoreductase [Mycolicibacterium aichiense]MCV7021521.1 LLM class F420-dependent oxidoreductase [Mycolicibacterium aichiense]BBX06102.1 LLM class F420-dependent oxidoreductase [Mycolicibacterium aichiense]STZ24558.1 putative oxidoreductase [Mycolicibacterium aichiense]
MVKDFRFGIGVRSVKSAQRLRETVRRFEDLGFDVLHVPDHLGRFGVPAPFPTMVAAAEAAKTMRVGTFVINAAFYKPAILARDAVAVDVLSEGRLDLGLGTGYVREEFEAAEMPYPSAGERVDHLRHTTKYLKQTAPTIPILIAGNGDRVLRIAAQYADIIGLTGGGVPEYPGHDPLAERIEFVRAAAGGRFGDLELNIAITGVPTDSSGIPDLALTRGYAPDATEEQLLALPTVLTGTPRDIADTLRARRDDYGITYFTVQDYHAEYFAKVIAELR